MKNASWLDALDHELQAAGVSATRRMEIIVETEGFLQEADFQALEHFGSAENYALAIAAALTPTTVNSGSSQTAQPAVVALEISKSYRKHLVLHNTSLEMAAGSLVALIGPNGAGKSTLLKIIAGIEKTDSGSVHVEGSIGYVPQDGGLDPYLLPTEHFALFGAAAGLGRHDAVQRGTRLALDLGWDATSAPVAGELSGGTLQKLNVITALMSSPDVLLLDEPYQGMDADSARRFWELLWSWQEQGGTALVSSHSPDALRKASAVVEIDGLAVR